MCECVCVCVTMGCTLYVCDPWTVDLQAPLPMEFSRQEYWSGLPFPTTQNLPHPEMEL